MQTAMRVLFQNAKFEFEFIQYELTEIHNGE